MSDTSPLTTGVDALVELVGDRKSISFAEAASRLRVPVATVEAWATFLEEEGLVSIEYSFTKPYLTTPKKVAAQGVAVEAKVKKRGVEPSKTALAEQDSAMGGAVESAIDQARAAISAGDIERAKQIYDQLKNAYDNFPERMRSERETIIQTLRMLHEAYLGQASAGDSTAMKAAQDVRDALTRTHDLAAQGDLEAAASAFAAAEDAFGKISQDAVELRLILTPSISTAQQALVEAEEKHASKDWNKQLERVNQILDQLENALKSQDVSKAIALHEQLEIAKKGLPLIYSEEKLALENKALPSYEKLLQARVELMRRECDQKIATLQVLVSSVQSAIKSKNLPEAQRQYEMAKKVYETIPNEYFERKVQAQKPLLVLAKEVSELELKAATGNVKQRVIVVEGLIDDAKSALERSDYSKARDAYEAALARFLGLPKGFSDLKKEVREGLVFVYERLLRGESGAPMTRENAKAEAPRHEMPQKAPDLSAPVMSRFKIAFGKHDWDEAIAAADSLALLACPEKHARQVAMIQNQASLLKDAASLDMISSPEERSEALRRFHKSYIAMHKHKHGDKKFFSYLKKSYEQAHRKHETLLKEAKKQEKAAKVLEKEAEIAEKTFEPAKSDILTDETWQSWEDALKTVTRVPETPAPKIVPEMPVPKFEFPRPTPKIVIPKPTPAESVKELPQIAHPSPESARSWFEALALWKDALGEDAWADAIRVHEVFESLGPVPVQYAEDAMRAARQAQLLIEANSLEQSHGDKVLLRALLKRFHEHYMRLLADYPDDKHLYTYCKKIYMGAHGAAGGK